MLVTLAGTFADVAETFVECIVENFAGWIRGTRVDDLLFEDIDRWLVLRLIRTARTKEIDRPSLGKLIGTCGLVDLAATRAHDERGHRSRLREREQ
jgi:hypothetical protein